MSAMTMRDGIQTRKDAKGRKRFRGVIHTKATGKRYGPWTGSHAEARSWRAQALGQAREAPQTRSTTTLREEWEAFIAGAEAGTIHDRSGRPYKPATLRGYRRCWARIDPELGAHRLSDIRRVDVQDMVDRWAAEGLAPSTVRNSLDPLRVLYRRAVARDKVAVNPTTNVEVPRLDGRVDRFATSEEATALIAALPDDDRALWATALFAGLRRGELRALRWDAVDLAAGIIHVRRSWDDSAGEIEPKTRGSKRRVPIVPPLAALLAAHADATGRSGRDLVFGRTATTPFEPSTVRARARRAWSKAGLESITLHECRHSAASMFIASGANAKALSVVLGHASIDITFDRYGKLMPGGEDEVGRLLGAYLAS